MTSRPVNPAIHDYAIRHFKMISAGEARARQRVGGGVLIGLLTYIGLRGTSSVSVGLQALLYSAGLVVYRMGVESQ